ncbi:hypothetical protein F5B19DRAFT_146734 [Rostrohypoxylon terebratum]|nr:hypothetical protein F5B19DRAFT_146734 [Rostrohypoxylon terebratum]
MAPLTAEEITEFIKHKVDYDTVFVLLTSCQGSWPNTGLGGALKECFPAAYNQYKTLCAEHSDIDGRPTDILAGTCHANMLHEPSDTAVVKLP